MKVRLLTGALALVAASASLTAVATTAGAKTGAASTTHYYVALGDSLSVGYQPNHAGVGHETVQGYTNDIYAMARLKVKNLKLVEFGCPGETTTSMLTGQGNTIAAEAYKCDLQGGSQLTAAERFLKAHSAEGEVSLITLDIGANDVDGCASDPSVGAAEACVVKGVGTLEANTPKILAGIKQAAAKGTPLAAMNLYDPVLADGLSSDASVASLATLSLSLTTSVNAAIAKADTAAGFKTANVAKAFNTYDTAAESTAGTALSASGLSTAPTDLVNICDLTYMCAPAPVGPNIHANPHGYALIAGAFELLLPKSV